MDIRKVMRIRREYLCECCGTKIYFKYSKASANKFCSSKCQWEVEWRDRKLRFEERGFVDPNSKSARRYLLDRFGHICIICELEVWQNKPIPLVCDHINGNSDDWAIDNLRMICCNCDALTDTYKAKNKGKGRHSRRIRYASGKSY